MKFRKLPPMSPEDREYLKVLQGCIDEVVGRAVDRVLAHKPKPKSKPARKRARRAKKIAKEAT
jgi:hypothetical protein